MSDTSTNPTTSVIDFAALLLGTLGFTDDEYTSLGYEGTTRFQTAVLKPAVAITAAGKASITDTVYFGVNPVHGPERESAGRGTEADVTRLAALVCDLDVKPGACSDLGVAHAIIDDLSAILGTRPSVTVESGYGLHAYWAVDGCHIPDGDIGAARALLKRWGRLVAVVADKFTVHVDTVFDLARMLRIPGSYNNKNTNGQGPRPVIARTDTGGPLTVDEIDERLCEYGIQEQPGDREAHREEVCPPSEWAWAEDTCGYVATMIATWVTDAPKPGAGRNPWFFSQHIRLACAHRLGCITEADYGTAQTTLASRLGEIVRSTEPRREPKKFEIADMRRHGVVRAAAKTDDEARAELGGHTHDTGATDFGDDDHQFWSQTEVLAHVHAFARSRGASPYATLGTVLRRAAGCIEPHVVLPPVVGGQVSLNLFTAPVGASGAGKDIANAAGHDAIDFYISIGSALLAVDDATLIHPGTGEGLARVFAGRGSQPGETRAHLQVPDVATLEALAGRKGQTLVSQLLAAYMGQPIGFSNNAKDTSTAVGAHSYRLCLSVGVQPENADFFLSRENHGFPQRFLWLPTTDPHAPADRPQPVSPRSFELPQFPLDGDAPRVEIPIPHTVADEIWFHRWQVLTGADGVDPLDAHLKLTQLKVAAAVAVLHGHTEVTEADWKIAGHLIDVSAKVRTGLQDAVKARRHRENTAKAHDQADRQSVVEMLLADEHQRRVRKAITRKLQRVGTAAEYELSKACDSSIRDDFKSVFDLCLDEGFIVCCEKGGSGHAARYRLG